MIKTTLKSFILIAAAATLSACSNVNTDEIQPSLFSAFATLESTSGKTTFSVQEEGTTTPVMLTSTVGLGSSFTVGKRYVIQYSTADNKQYSPGPITLYGIYNVYQGTIITATTKEILDASKTPINVTYSSLTGDWTNLTVTAPISQWPKNFSLYVNEETLHEAYPDVYIGFTSDNNSSNTQGTVFGSFDMSPLWEHENVQGFTLYYTQNNTPQSKRITRPKR